MRVTDKLPGFNSRESNSNSRESSSNSRESNSNSRESSGTLQIHTRKYTLYVCRSQTSWRVSKRQECTWEAK